ncbi:mRNA turnover protein 4 [Durotheca rogersii]|uniref:mRNA turnover protein 4 n=1 Tax=Durotheca rogersii TaxID=419775 RepID=UPI00221E7897|nr:mRNA turnover protein 4 [Durotheca rogersii]KAI5860516.1 mRNA turnover protein 4 [Durotheca rogersii]
MPKSKRSKVVHMTKVTKKTREHKERLFDNIRDAIAQHQYCFVFAVDNMRNTYLKDLRQELSDSRFFFGKTKLMARALGRTAADSAADGTWALAAHVRGTVGLLVTSRAPGAVLAQLGAVRRADFARAGAVAPRGFALPPGALHATGGEVPAEHDVPVGHALEPELRRLGLPVRMARGRVELDAPADGAGHVVCRAGDVLDARQTRLLKLFDVCLAEFRVRVVAYWTAATGEVTLVDPDAAPEQQDEDADEELEDGKSE